MGTVPIHENKILIKSCPFSDLSYTIIYTSGTEDTSNLEPYYCTSTTYCGTVNSNTVFDIAGIHPTLNSEL